MTLSARLLLVLAAVVVFSPCMHAGLILDLTEGGSAQVCGLGCGTDGTTFGWSFTVGTQFTIDGIGVWNAGSAGLGGLLVPAALYTAEGVLLQSVIVSGGSTAVASASASGSWLFEYFTPLILPAGTYLVGQVFWDEAPPAQVDPLFTIMPGVTFNSSVLSGSNSGLAPPLDPFELRIFGPTLSGTTIPEPGTLAFVGLGLAGLLLLRRRLA